MKNWMARFRGIALCTLLSTGLLALSAAVPAQAAESLDSSFGDGGIAFPGPGGADIRALAQGTGGALVGVGGRDVGFFVARYLSDGTRDRRFAGGRGWAVSDLSVEAQANAVTVQPDGKILAAGSTETGTFVLIRYEPDGSRRDPSFGGGRAVRTIAGFYGGGAQDLEIQPSGRILATGYGIDFHRRWKAMVTAYRPDGSPDRSFGRHGVVTLKPTAKGEVPIELVALEALPNGKILAVGTLSGRVMLLRLRSDGQPDRSFGKGGLRYLDVDRDPQCLCVYATDMQVDRRGRIVIAANVTGPSEREPAALIRILPNGRLDKSFGERGVARALIGSRLASKAVTLQRDGRIVLAGTYNVPGSGEARVAAVRFLPDGRIDRGFARRGFFTRDFGYEGVAYAALTQRDGKVVIAGRANSGPSDFPENPSVYDTASVFLIRFLP